MTEFLNLMSHFGQNKWRCDLKTDLANKGKQKKAASYISNRVQDITIIVKDLFLSLNIFELEYSPFELLTFGL